MVRVPRAAGVAPRLTVILAVLLAAGACGTPIGVIRGDTQSAYRALTRSVLSAGKPSAATEEVLQRLGLAERFDDEPEAVLAELRGPDGELAMNHLFALAELSFLHADQERKREYYLAAAIYAYGFMVRGAGAPAAALDPRARLAADIYNLGMSLGLAVPPEDADPAGHGHAGPEAGEVLLTDRTLRLPFGQLELSADPDDFVWGGYRMSRFVAVGEFETRGMRVRYRQPGIGAPLAAELTPLGSGPDALAARRRIPSLTKVPVTAFVRLDNVLRGIVDGRLKGRIELYSADEATTVEVGGRKLPLELEPTATLAYQLEGSPVWDTEIAGFLSAGTRLYPESLIMMHPYRPGRVPVVLVHGTVSSPARWADVVNELQNDPSLREHVQVWLFVYNSSNPILLSARELRDSLRDIVRELDPEEKDPALRRMVLIGHSQGGLLTRLMVTESGDRFWNNLTSVPFSEIRVAPEVRTRLASSMFFEPLPFVTRVVFIATPHRGSFRVSSMVLNLVRRLVTLPVTLVKGFGDFAQLNPGAVLPRALKGLPTAVDNMSPGSPFIEALSACPVGGHVALHSIVAVRGDGPVQGKTDGVVTYESAHLDAVESEKVVRSGHSTQGHPETVLEVMRILRLHVSRQ